MSKSDKALRAVAKIDIRTPTPTEDPVLYSGPYLDIRYRVCPKSAVASSSRTIYTIDIKRLRDLHGQKWFEHLLVQTGWKFGNPTTHDMTIHAEGGDCSGTLTAADLESATARMLGRYVFHVHFAKRPAPLPGPRRPYAFDIERK